jgi:hypothetical protein
LCLLLVGSAVDRTAVSRECSWLGMLLFRVLLVGNAVNWECCWLQVLPLGVFGWEALRAGIAVKAWVGSAVVRCMLLFLEWKRCVDDLSLYWNLI